MEQLIEAINNAGLQETEKRKVFAILNMLAIMTAIKAVPVKDWAASRAAVCAIHHLFMNCDLRDIDKFAKDLVSKENVLEIEIAKAIDDIIEREIKRG